MDLRLRRLVEEAGRAESLARKVLVHSAAREARSSLWWTLAGRTALTEGGRERRPSLREVAGEGVVACCCNCSADRGA